MTASASTASASVNAHPADNAQTLHYIETTFATSDFKGRVNASIKSGVVTISYADFGLAQFTTTLAQGVSLTVQQEGAATIWTVDAYAYKWDASHTPAPVRQTAIIYQNGEDNYCSLKVTDYKNPAKVYFDNSKTPLPFISGVLNGQA